MRWSDIKMLPKLCMSTKIKRLMFFLNQLNYLFRFQLKLIFHSFDESNTSIKFLKFIFGEIINIDKLYRNIST